jgi:uncharacterized protein YjiS (DUF1127 family)
MATIDTNRTYSDNVQGIRLGNVVASFFATLSAWNDARITRNSLSRLSARELDDIGLCRGDIDEIVARGGRF